MSTLNNYKNQLDGLRCFCILFTILQHTPGNPWFINGTVGVDIFFALSGWLITSLLLQETKTRGSIQLGSFYIRRIFRIVPLYYLTCAFYAGSSFALLTFTGSAAKWQAFTDALPYLLSFNSEYRAGVGGSVFGHAWTLGIEEKFYIIWPAILFFLGRNLTLTAATTILVVSPLFIAAVTDETVWRGYFGIGSGAALALIVQNNPALIALFSKRKLAWFIFVAMLVPYILSITVPVFVVWNILIGTISAALIASIWHNPEQGISRFLSFGPFVWLGKLTYAIYLIQTLCINLGEILTRKLGLGESTAAIFLLSYAISVGLAWLLHVSVEKPFINIGRDLARRPVAATA